jgi:DNA-binding response OmpR family regulator
MVEDSRTKILIVDDEESLRTLLKAVLSTETNRFSLFEAEDGEQALKKVYDLKPNILLIDVVMPGHSGFEVCEKIREDTNLNQLKIIILSAKGEESEEKWAFSIGADYFLSKPFDPLELLNLIIKIDNENFNS